MMTEVLVLADDLTGALEVGALFRAAGADTLVGIEQTPQATVAIADLETRHIDFQSAGERIRREVEAARQVGIRFVYLKTDSTLRGPIGAELEGVLKAWPGAPLHYAPAYPAMGRTVRGGKLFVNGVPLIETAFARDPDQPARSSDVREALGCPMDERLHIYDGETDQDLVSLAEGIVKKNEAALVAGPAGIAAELARVLPIPRSAPAPLPRAARGMVISGSQHPASKAQLRHAGDWAVIESSGPKEGALQRLAENARAMMRMGGFEVLVLFGGDTAYTVLRAFGVRRLSPIGQVLTGIAVSTTIVEGIERVIVTKAGGFGAEEVLPRIREALKGA